MRPASWGDLPAGSVDERSIACFGADVRRDRRGPLECGRDLVGAAEIGHDDGRAPGMELASECFADAPTRSGDHDVASTEFHPCIVGSPSGWLPDWRMSRPFGPDVAALRAG